MNGWSARQIHFVFYVYVALHFFQEVSIIILFLNLFLLYLRPFPSICRLSPLSGQLGAVYLGTVSSSTYCFRPNASQTTRSARSRHPLSSPPHPHPAPRTSLPHRPLNPWTRRALGEVRPFS